MSRKVYITESLETSISKTVIYGSTSIEVDDKIATKMLEVYDEAQKFEPVKVDLMTTVKVNSKFNTYFPIEVWFGGQLRCYDLPEIKRFSEALLSAADFVEKRR